jgi:translation initiation factor 4G
MTSPLPSGTSTTAQTVSSSPSTSGTPPAGARSSYAATATKGKPGPPAIVGHGKLNASPVNGKPTGPPPNVGPVVVNSNGPQVSDHSRKSSVTIQANSNYLPNGGSAVPSPSRQTMQFGAMTAGTSPAIVNSVPNLPPNSNLTTPMAGSTSRNPPSPIPQPTVSGGRPPSGPQAQSGPVAFGSFTGSDNGSDGNVGHSIDITHNFETFH